MADGRNVLKILPLGGLGEIGMNMTLYGCGDDWIAVDAGVQFCDATQVGAEMVLPDLDLLAEYRGRLKALVITHGHEDHVGAVPHVMAACPVPVYAPAFVVELLRIKGQEYPPESRPQMHVVAPGDRLDFGEIGVEFVRVTHSIPDSHSLVLRTPVGTVVHTGDFKIDPEPADGRKFDAATFSRLGDEGVRLLLSDSTNAHVAGRTRPDRDVLRGLERVLLDAPDRVIVSLFASNVYRVSELARIADRHRRRVALVGRSLNVYLEAARRAGLVPPLPDFVEPSQVDKVPGRDLLVICTGSQAEGRSALCRASRQDHPDLRIRQGDRVVLSSRIIPGNERPIHRMMNDLARLGARIIHERMAPIHGSGHAQRDELMTMIELTRPRTFVPIHGEFSFLEAHAEMAGQAGVHEVRVVENGQTLEVSADETFVGERIQLRNHYVDGPIVGDWDELRLDERKRIGWTGVVAARLIAEWGKKRWRVDLEVQSVGCPTGGGSVLDDAAAYAAEQVASLPREASRAQVEETLSASLRAFFRRRIDRKPSVLAFVEVRGD